MELLQFLAELGLPSAIVGMVTIAWLFRKQSPIWANVAVGISIFLAAIFGIIQIVVLFTGSDIKITTTPKNVYAITPRGKPTDLMIQIKRQGSLLDSMMLRKPSVNSYEDRMLSLSLITNKQSRKFAATYEGNQLGVINFQMLRNKGWHSSTEIGGGNPLSWSTYRVYIGQEVTLGETEHGQLKIILHKVSDKAVVSLKIEGKEEPIPKSVSVPNKGVDSQDFPDLPTYYIVVREADFKKGWAAFNVFTIR